MKNLNKRIEMPVPDVENEPEEITPKVKGDSKIKKANRTFFEIIGGKMLSKDSFVRMMYFVFYIVFLLMLYITNVYIAEDVNRYIYRLNRQSEELRVEYVFMKSEITKITKQSNLVKMLENKGIKESVDPLVIIVANEEGGADE